MDASAPDIATLFAGALGDTAGESEADGRILDAAVAEIGARGARAATIDAIAERAGVARITVFRRFGSKGELVQRMVLRELRRFLDDLQASSAEDDLAERVVAAFVACVRASREHPLAARVQPGDAFAQLTSGRPSVLDLGVSFVAAQLAGDAAHERAEVLVRVALTYSLVPGDTDVQAARAFARRVLVPIALG